MKALNSQNLRHRLRRIEPLFLAAYLLLQRRKLLPSCRENVSALRCDLILADIAMAENNAAFLPARAPEDFDLNGRLMKLYFTAENRRC